MEKEINIKEYLNKILYLENEKERLEQIEKKIDNFINYGLKPINKSKFIDYHAIDRKKNIEIKQYENKFNIEKPIPPQEPTKTNKIKYSPTILLIVGIIEFFLGMSIDFSFVSVLGGFVAVVSLLGVFAQISINKNYKQEVSEYENKLLNYNTSLDEYNKKIKANKQKVESFNTKIQKKYDNELEKREKVFEEKSLQISTIKEENKNLLKETKKNLRLVNNKLKKLYDLDIIFEKYRNLIAIATFVEYFASSRVSELEGKDGAYNLFESEIRQNIIIIQLDRINNNLDAIKQNQYILYKELNSINDSLYVITDNINNIERITSDIRNVSIDTNIVNKYILGCTSQINKNISTIKDITMADFYIK